MTAEPATLGWNPDPRDLQSAVATFVARMRDGKRAAAVVMKMATENGRLFLLVDSLLWLLWRQYSFEEIPEAIDRLEEDLLKLAAMIAEEDNTDE